MTNPTAEGLSAAASTRVRTEWHSTASGYVVEISQVVATESGAVDSLASDPQVTVTKPDGGIVATMAPTVPDAWQWAADFIANDRA